MKYHVKIIFLGLLLSLLTFALLSQKRAGNVLQDTDKDGISDLVENLSSLNANEDECSYKKFSNSCKNVAANGLMGREHFIYILDQSGSMQKKLGQQTRMAVAKEIVTKYVKNLPDNFYGVFAKAPMRLGVYSYGKTKSCEQVYELQSPYKRLKRKALIRKIKEMKPYGRTPIAYSLNHIAEVIKQKNKGKFHIMLVSDGVESCRRNPIQAARDLVALNSLTVSVKLSVVGLGVPKDIEAELQKIAQASNGQYHTIHSANEFKQVLASPFRQMIKNLNGLVCLQKITDRVIACENKRIVRMNRGYQKINNPFYGKLTDSEKEKLNRAKEEFEQSAARRVKTYQKFKQEGSDKLAKKANALVKYIGKISKLR